MKAELQIDIQELVTSIVNGVVKELKPLLEQGRFEHDTLFTIKSLAKYLEVSDQWVYERVHLQEIPHIKMGKFPRFKESEIDHWLDTLKIPSLQPLSCPLRVLGARKR